MATSRGLGQFSRRMKLRAKGLGKNAENAVRKAAIAADQTAVLSTPVDTGRARANWITSVGTVPDLVTESTDPTGAAALGQGVAVAGGWKLGQGTIFISNGVPYIIPLDEGSSAQAPSGMSQQAATAARRELGKHKLLKPGKR